MCGFGFVFFFLFISFEFQMLTFKLSLAQSTLFLWFFRATHSRSLFAVTLNMTMTATYTFLDLTSTAACITKQIDLLIPRCKHGAVSSELLAFLGQTRILGQDSDGELCHRKLCRLVSIFQEAQDVTDLTERSS